MADMRQSLGILDDFERADENPIKPPWITVPGAFDNKLESGALGGTRFPPDSCNSYFSAFTSNIPGTEMWAIAGGDPGLTAGWRYGIYTVASIESGFPDGYQCLPHLAIGGGTWILRRIDGGTPVDLGGTSGLNLPNGGDICLMRRNGNDIEVWISLDDGANWQFRNSATDTTYVNGPWYFSLGTTGTETGWLGLGGGQVTRQQIYRWINAQ